MHGVMLRATRLIAAAALTSLAFAASTEARTTASLTAPEFQQLSTVQTQLRTVRKPTAKGLRAAVRVCEQIPQLTSLLISERSSCLYAVNFVRTGLLAESTARTCSEQRASSSDLACAIRSYQAVRIAAVGLIQADSEMNMDVRSRGFSGVCAVALGSQPKLLRQERRVAADMARLIAATKTLDHSAAQADVTRLIHDSAAEAATQILDRKSLTACPHA